MIVKKYNNNAAYLTIKNAMQQNKKVEVSFYLDKCVIPSAWVKFEGVTAFAYQLHGEVCNGLLNYLREGIITDFDTAPEDVTPVESLDEVMIPIVKNMVENGDKIDLVPIFRAYPNTITGVASYKFGKIIFRVTNTSEMIGFFIDHGFTIL